MRSATAPGAVNRNSAVHIVQAYLGSAAVDRGIQAMTARRAPCAAEIRVDAPAQVLRADIGARTRGQGKPDRPVHRSQRDRVALAHALEIGVELPVDRGQL